MIEDFLPVNGSDFDCGNRANSLTCAATNAFVRVYLRKLPLRFGDCRTGTFHNAQSALNTGIFIDGSQPDLRFLFFGESYASDCAGRADFRAFIAIVIAKTFLVFYMHSGKFIVSFFMIFIGQFVTQRLQFRHFSASLSAETAPGGTIMFLTLRAMPLLKFSPPLKAVAKRTMAAVPAIKRRRPGLKGWELRCLGVEP